MKVTFIAVFVLVLFAIILGQIPNYSEGEKIETQEIKAKCSPIVEGLQLCTPLPNVIVKKGENIPIQLILKNTTENLLTVINGSFSDIYQILVTDSAGKKVLSTDESLAEKIKNSNATESQIDLELPLNSSPQKIQLAAQQEIKIEYNLKDVYDIRDKGKYQIEISRRVPKKDGVGTAELSLGTIEIEIK